ncbi:ATP-binding cassette domain-containing protein [Paenibacillus radicis (ex Gao et al. 2016)]|uniref:Energy-coupling factor transporter ATP-binding protein EcfA n=1 Tax=Paenibacillus radicis (ex Gao et al. 2016) TaxID=1737354 RepID=A0A917LVR1_9BACL|nr:ATP-binding cassette domain-containing protein [Paenibacillus radicis (ex Gao et al. 2016)]GGG58211.1 energy-coupling factor transporter ATP-binding protein EcfA [Paenibacillus radicis (ex Gao et al. 2016)]
MQIQLSDVSFIYEKKKKKKASALAPAVLKQLNVTIHSGEMLAIAGKSGSGKSTFLQLLKGFLAPTTGSVLLDGVDPNTSKRPELFDQVGFIFQYPEHQLFSTTVFDDIAFGLQSAKLPREVVEQKVRKAMESVELDYEVFKDRSPFELSGGEKRRVAIAGVVVLEPKLLILDEPTAGLDLPSRTALFELLHQLNEKQGLTIIWVSHQLDEIVNHASRLLALKNGIFIADGSPEATLSDPVLLDAFGWEEPSALVVSRLLEQLGISSGNGKLSPEEAAAVISTALNQQQILAK